MKKTGKWLKIGELEQISGTSRHTIHSYVQIGLLHPPVKTGKTMAYYDESHIEKLKYIHELKKQGLTLAVIREKISDLVLHNYFQVPDSEHFRLKKKDTKGRKVPKRLQGKKTQESILNLATTLFKEKGYKATKVSDITSRLKIGKGSFYFFFNDKKELFLACVPRIFEALFSLDWERIRHEEDPLKRLELRIQAALPVVEDFATIIKLSKEVLESDDPKLRKLGKKILTSIRKPIEADIKKCIEKGVIRPVEPKMLSIMTIGVVWSLDLMLSLDKEISLSAMENHLYDIFRMTPSN